MALSLKHSKVSDKSDGQDDSLLQPSDWNAEHKFTVGAKKLIGNSDASSGDIEELSIGDGLTLEEGALTLGGLSDAQIVVAVADTVFPGARVVTDTATVTWDKPATPDEDTIKANVPDNAITLAKLEHGTHGDIFYYGASGAPARLPVGVAGSFLKTGTAAVVGPPAVDATIPSWGFPGAPHAVLRDKKANGTDGGAYTAGDATTGWRDRVLNEEVYDTYTFVGLTAESITNVTFTLVAGTYVLEWSAPAFGISQHQTRLYNKTDNATIEVGTSEVSGSTAPVQTRSTGIAYFVIPASKNLAIQHRGGTTKAGDGFGSAANFSGYLEVYTIVKIWRVA